MKLLEELVGFLHALHVLHGRLPLKDKYREGREEREDKDRFS